MSFYSFTSSDSKVTLGFSALNAFNKFASPSAVLKEKTIYMHNGVLFFEHLDNLVYIKEDSQFWKPFHVFENGVHIQQGIFESVRSNLETGEREEIPIVKLKDYKKDIKIKYSFTKIDTTKINKTMIISKKSLATFLETLLLIADSKQPFSLYINNESLKDEYRTT